MFYLVVFFLPCCYLNSLFYKNLSLFYYTFHDFTDCKIPKLHTKESKRFFMFFDFHLKTQGQIQIQKIPSHSLTPIMILQDLKAKALLESAYQETGKGRYSLMLLSPAFCLIKENDAYFLLENQTKTSLSAMDPSKDFLDWVEFFGSLSPEAKTQDFPLPMRGIGYLGFEFFQEIEGIKNHKKKSMQTYECAFLFGRDFLIFDHLHDCAYLVSINYAKEKSPLDLLKRIKKLEEKIKNLSPKDLEQDFHPSKILSPSPKEDFLEMVEKIKKEITAGNLLQCVASTSMQIQSALPPIDAYKRLRQNNPSPYMFYFDFGGFQLFGTSPEMMIKIHQQKILIAPIAGTRKRGKNTAQDLALEAELKNDEKENAEHLMLLDLARNDIGKVAKIGSVEVTKFKNIERYSQVMHIVSQVEGDFDGSYSHKDAIFATFPAGTVSGAPKIQAIKTLYALEPHQRGIYGGLIGYFDGNGNFDSAITIRTAVYQNGIYHLQAGAGIVQDSRGELEFLETQNKMRALTSAILQEKGE
ncbi:putative anthranilate synthase component I [Helicobacter mustelae 12198]|uniref:Anthranilate synthase component 1 n=2 Tax=Helicobacter mustelae TaxID=217 RepID=D3UGQ2_HELM1|nr:putative anthranilate synthase component I [Helicobacter mustelae 12198]